MLQWADACAHGRWTPLSRARALRWYRKAAAAGSAEAMFELAWLDRWHWELSAKQSRRRERHRRFWLRQAALAGLPGAQHQYGEELLAHPETESEGLRWIERAAEGWNPEAMRLLAARAEQGAEPDLAEAFQWKYLARQASYSPDNEPLEAWQAWRSQLDRETRVAGKERVLAWLARHPKPVHESVSTGDRKVVEAHERPVGKILADAHDEPYAPLRTFEEARAAADGVVIAEGDYGGQIYFTCPARLVRCDEALLWQLLEDVDATQWGSVQEGSASLYFERLPVGSGVWGGMGGGQVVEGVWVHDDLRDQGDDGAIRDVLEGRRRFFEQPTDEQIRERAAAGDAVSLFRMAEWAREGAHGEPMSPELRVARLEQAAELGHEGAMAQLANIFEFGHQGLPADPVRALRWLLKLEQSDRIWGRGWTVTALGRHYEHGLGVPRDGEKAMAYYRLAVRSPDDFVALGMRYLRGGLVPVDADAALQCFKRAAEEYEYGAPYFAMGLLYHHGWGKPRDPALARRYFEQAARHDHAPAILHLAWLLARGQGGPVDLSEALFWALGAEDLGDRRAGRVVVCLKARMDPCEFRLVQGRWRAMQPPPRRPPPRPRRRR